MNSLLKSKLTLLFPVDLTKVINISYSFFETINAYNDKIQFK